MYATIEEAKTAAIEDKHAYFKCIIVYEKGGQFGYVIWSEIKYVWTIVPSGSKPIETARFNYDTETHDFQPYTLTRANEMRATGHGGKIADALEDIENGADWKSRLDKLMDDTSK